MEPPGGEKVAPKNERPAAIVSVITTLVAVEALVFDTTMVYVRSPPAATGSGMSVSEICKSIVGDVLSTSIANSDVPPLGSVQVAETGALIATGAEV
jgi:hypothetical protein